MTILVILIIAFFLFKDKIFTSKSETTANGDGTVTETKQTGSTTTETVKDDKGDVKSSTVSTSSGLTATIPTTPFDVSPGSASSDVPIKQNQYNSLSPHIAKKK
ncbi:MAG: hypothetical protein RBT61_12410 [Candidatus Kapabacteria bacterium]|jgi:hypothetical protein|nr:hypothetical protein [Candidatus Kapabacteria bacterium]